ncbi:peptidase M16 [Alteromonas halophila]|uniref:Protease 3 n=2 Tax=Alteromonas halophila TaxID=516698 RepID=A0A918JCF6_9ALTE|nr:peptidase M16 [Alteromonas halophila]
MACQQNSLPACFVSLSLRAGHFYDPNDCQGLAHLLEHMVFMGSRHLPKPNALNDFIERFGGNLNAWTGTEYANFHYSCERHALEQTLPAFADALRQPLLNIDAIQNEVRSIDAEFKFKRKDDLRRLYQIHKETCNPAHPFSKFSVGNQETFTRHSADKLRTLLKDFHSQYYCARNMCLCIATPLPVSELSNLLEQSFGGFAPGELAPADWPLLYTPDQLGIEIAINPLQQARRLIVTFALPGLHNEFKTKPLNYISHLLGDEGEGSLLAYLKERGWASNLIAGSGIEGDAFKDFNISFQLTKQGLKDREQVLNALFSYLELVKQSVDTPWRFHEKAQLAALANQYDENIKPLTLVCDYAQYLFMYSAEEISQFRSLVDSFDATLINNAMRYFTPDNMRVKVIAPEVATSQTCRFYEAKYQVNPLDDALLEQLRTPQRIDGLALPPPNPYLGGDYQLTLPESGQDTPHCITDKPGKQIWFAQDQQFHSPKGDIYLSFDVPAFSDNLHNVAAKRIWLGTLNDYLQAKYYRAEIAGLHYRIYGHQCGLTLHTRGFTNQQCLLAEQLLSAIMSFTPDQATFEHHKAMQRQNLQNTLLNKPTNRLFSRLSVLIQRNTQAPVELIDALCEVSYASMSTTMAHALDSYYIEGLMHGNWSASQANSFADTVDKACADANGQPLSRAVSRLPVGAPLYHEVPCEHDDASVVLYLQAPSANLQDTAMCMLLEQMLAAPFFNVLRTEKQLGYIVGTGYVPHNQHPGIAFYVQSPNQSPSTLLSAITSFLFQQLGEIEFYRHYWPTIQQNLLKQLQEHDLSLSMKSQRLWVSLGIKDRGFNRNAQLAAMVSQLTFEDIQSYAHSLAERSLFGELVLFSRGRFAGIDVPEDRSVNSISSFKQRISYFR